MDFEITTLSKTSPVEMLDMHVQNKREAGRSFLSVQVLYRRDQQDNQMKMPLLTWFDANQLQHFAQQVFGTNELSKCQIDLPDAGLRLTGYGQQSTAKSMIKVEALPDSGHRFTPIAINGNSLNLEHYSQLLSQRLWEAFCRG